jgi:uncharacterized membrane protein YesL
MKRALALLGGAIAAWWRELLFLLVLNFLWLVAQVSVVFGPPATAAMYAVAQRVLNHELVDFGDAWRAGKEAFAVSWAWGLAQLAVYAVLGYNLLFYGARGGLLLATLRWAWALLACAWFASNLYFWPLYLAQSDRRFLTTMGNALKMALLNPGYTLGYAALALLLIAVSALSGLLLGAVLAAWLALWGSLVVEDRLLAAGQLESADLADEE